MATLKFVLRTKSESANIYVYYSIDKKTRLYRKTGKIINPKNWSSDKGRPLMRDENLKNLSFYLDRLEATLKESYNNAIGKGTEFTGEWLQDQIDTFNGKKILVDLDVLTNYINKYAEDAPYKTKANGEIGLSKNRIINIKKFYNRIKEYEKETMNCKSILVKDVNPQFVEEFKRWRLSKGYSINTVGDNIKSFKTICNDASRNDIKTSPKLINIKSISESKAPEAIIFLSEEEQKTIKNIALIRESQINVRKWLLLGCLIGQRGGDLLNIKLTNIKELGGIKIIELRQQKTKKLVSIPLNEDAQDIIKDGLPYKISLKNFNKHIKDICKLADLNTPTIGRKKITNDTPTKKSYYPKWELMSSHCCRRSFATNYYGLIPTPILMNITAHGTETMFLAYIGKPNIDYALQMMDYLNKLKPKENIPIMEAK
jgi:site-specific recombinase XerD